MIHISAGHAQNAPRAPGVAQPSSAGRDERAVEDLWAWTEAELAAKGYEVPAVGVTEAVAVASSVA